MASILNVILRVTGQSSLGGTFTGLNQGLQLAQALTDGLNSSIGQFVRRGFEMNASLETTTLQFKTLMGSADEATKHVADLFKIGAETPFETGEIIEASRNLRVLGGAALDTHENILLVGDAAAATSADIKDVAFWTGRAYSAMQAGRPYGEASQRLQELGILSADARNKMEDLQKAGASASEQWQVLDADFRRFNGAMQEQAGTWKGLTSTMSDSFDMLAAHVTQPAFKQAEQDLRAINAALSDPQTTQNAETLGNAIGFIAEEGTRLAGTLVAVSPAFQALNSVLTAYNALAPQTAAAADDIGDAFSRHADMADRAAAAIAAAIPIYKQAGDAWEDEAHAADTAALAVGGYRDESYRAAAAQQILNQQLEDARMAAAGAGDAFTRHPGLDMGVLTGGDLSGIDAIMKRQQDAARAAEQAQRDQEKAARDQAQAEKQAARDAEAANRAAARATEQAWRAAHGGAARAAVGAAAVQVAAAHSVAAATIDATAAMQASLQASYGSPSGGLLMDTGSQAGRTRFYGMTLVQPTIVTNIDQRGATVGVDDLQRQIETTVNNGLRSGSVRVPGVSTR